MPIKECSLYTFTVNGTQTKTTPKDITARAAAEAAQATANGKQDALTATQLAAVNSGITAQKVAGYDAFSVPSAFSGSPEMDGTASPGSADTWARGDHVHPHDTTKQDVLTTAQKEAVNSGVTAAKVAAWDAIEVPAKTSDLTNDSGFITAAAIPAVPTKTSDLTNDSGFVTSAAIPDSTSDLTNDSGFITANDIPAIPSKTSDLQNDSGYITSSAIPVIPDSTSDLTNDSGFITASDIPPIPSKTSDLTNDSGFITGYTETDPTVPAWAKAPSKPTYTAAEVGALPDTTVIPTVPTKVSAFTNDAGYLTGYTETDPTVPSWAKQATKPTYTAAEVGALPDTTAIPTKTSDLMNDSGFMTSYTETDPTVPAWAKTASKPTYTASEVGALPSNTAIPSKTSDLTNDSGFAVVQSGTPTFNNTSYNLNYVSNASGKWQRIGNIVVFNVTYTMKGNISSSLANVFTGMPECDGYRHFLAESTTSEIANRHVTVTGTSISLAGAHSSGTTYHASGAYIAKS